MRPYFATLADAYVEPLEAYPNVKEAALKAISLDERDAEAHVYLGQAKQVVDWDLAGGETELKRALELDPNSAPARLFLGLFVSSEGDVEKGLTLIEQAKQLDPLSPAVSNIVSWFYLNIDRFDDAIAEGKRTITLDPAYIYYGSPIAAAYREKGDYERSIELYTEAQKKTHFPFAGLAITYARIGRQDEARRILGQLVEKAQTQYVAAYVIASVYVALGENDEAFRWLERAYAEHDGPLLGIGFNRAFRSLRSDPRFAHLLSRMGLNPAKALGRKENP
jgi:tetratricopeptide (TPR) repeat protein